MSSFAQNTLLDFGFTTASVIGGVVLKEFNFTAGQTDVALVTAGTSERIIVERVAVTVSKAVSAAKVEFRAGFWAAVVPAKSSSGVTGIVLSHPGLAAGSGYEASGEPLGVGATGEDLRFTCDAPTAGEITVLVSYRIVS